ncbi:hypothetical protein [Pseudogracilibacillus sp. ICA-222130]|uniref:hypothetical protein n=1 Tax=Pseudogracilibacillus sp. ICA-222130 TaxID=3134655 RepID=UPI0030BCBA32
MKKPFMYIEQPEISFSNRQMQETFYLGEKESKNHETWNFPTLLGNVVYEITVQDEKIRGEIIEEKETELIILDEYNAKRNISKDKLEHVQIIRM